MIRSHAAHASADDWRVALSRAAEGLGDDGRQASLGFCYVNDRFTGEADALLSALNAATGVQNWVGTIGAGICADGEEYFDTPAVSLLTLDLPADEFRIFKTSAPDLSDIDRETRDWVESRGCGLGVVHGDPTNLHIESMLSELTSLASGMFLVGGLSSTRRRHFQIANGTTEGGISGVLFSQRVAVTTRLSQGCSPIGPRHSITRSDGSIVMELDGRPALEVFAEEVSALKDIPPEQLAGFVYVAIPIKGSDTGDYLVRNLIGIDPDRGALAVGDALDDTEQLMFCKRDTAAAEEDLNRMLDEITRRLDGSPKAAVYFSCVARGPNLFGPESRELKLIREAIGSLPLTGFFGNGEISHNRLYGYTGVLTLFL